MQLHFLKRYCDIAGKDIVTRQCRINNLEKFMTYGLNSLYNWSYNKSQYY